MFTCYSICAEVKVTSGCVCVSSASYFASKNKQRRFLRSRHLLLTQPRERAAPPPPSRITAGNNCRPHCWVHGPGRVLYCWIFTFGEICFVPEPAPESLEGQGGSIFKCVAGESSYLLLLLHLHDSKLCLVLERMFPLYLLISGKCFNCWEMKSLTACFIHTSKIFSLLHKTEETRKYSHHNLLYSHLRGFFYFIF